MVAGLVVAASLPFAGCVDFDHLNLCEVTDTEGATVSHEQIRLRKGTVVALKGIPYGTDNGAMDEDTDVYMESADESVLGIAPLDYDGERCPGPDDAPWHYLLWGEEVGSTTLTIFVSGDPVMEIPVEVVD